MESFVTNTFDTHKNYNTPDTLNTPKLDNQKATESSSSAETYKTTEPQPKDMEQGDGSQKKRRSYTRRKTTESSNAEITHAEMKLFSVYVADGWNRVDGTVIAETAEDVKGKAFKLLKIDESEKDSVVVIINEIKTGIHLVQ